jgi:V8-like Glu-specific endopeptidase
LVVAAAIFVGLATTGAFAAVYQKGTNVVVTSPAQGTSANLDYQNAIPMPLPMANTRYGPSESGVSPQSLGTPSVSAGFAGSGKRTPVTLPLSPAAAGELTSQAGDVEPQEFGTSGHPFTTSRVDLYSYYPTVWWPYRAAGKLYFKIGSSTYVCSASLIKRGVIVTAAHCVANFGQKTFYTGWQFVPAMSGASAPYGTWDWALATVKTTYYNGTDPCYAGAPGVVCTNDVAIIVLAAKSGAYPGTNTGWFGYGTNGWGFADYNTKALINQLGYPVSHDSGLRMQRTDSQGFVSNWVSNTVWGGRQTGGSSGGPELVNLGVAASLSGTGYGSYSSFNIVVGVTSWGWTDTTVKQQGASPFTSTNISSLVSSACAGSDPRCQ